MTHEELIEYTSMLYDEDEAPYEMPEYAEAVIGTSHDERLVYSYEKLVHLVMNTRCNNIQNETEAREYIDKNIILSLPYYGSKAPIIVFSLPY